MTHHSLLISLVLCLILSITGYLSFLSDTKGDVLNNYSYENTLINVARALLAMTMVFTYPMENVCIIGFFIDRPLLATQFTEMTILRLCICFDTSLSRGIALLKY